MRGFYLIRFVTINCKTLTLTKFVLFNTPHEAQGKGGGGDKYRTMWLGCAGTVKNPPLVLNTPQKSVLKSGYPKKILAKFPTTKKSLNGKFQTPKKPFNHPRHLKSRVPPPPPPARPWDIN